MTSPKQKWKEKYSYKQKTNKQNTNVNNSKKTEASQHCQHWTEQQAPALSWSVELGPTGKGVWVVEAPGEAVGVMGTW